MCMYNLIDDKRHGVVLNKTIGELTEFLTENFSKDDEVIINGTINIVTDKNNNSGFSIGKNFLMDLDGISEDDNNYLCLWSNFNEFEDVLVNL